MKFDQRQLNIKKSLNIKLDHDNNFFILSSSEWCKLIRVDANNVDKKQQQKFIEWTSIKLPNWL